MSDHRFALERQTSEGAVFVCDDPGCGRKVVYTRRPRAYVVVDRGDAGARHQWSDGGVEVQVST